MKKIITLLLCFLCIIQSSAQDIVDKEFPLVDTLLEEFIKKGNLPGISLAISKNEKVIYAKGYGYSDVKKKTPMLPNTRLRTASVAKVITATALGKLMSEGNVQLDAPIQKYIPYIPTQYASLTLRQLSSHTSGMSHRPDEKTYKKKRFTEIKETILIMDKPLRYAPDTGYSYSTHAFNLIAGAIEGIADTNFEDYLNNQIFKSLGMKDTYIENIDSLSINDASLYYLKKGKQRTEKLTSASYKVAGAGFRSTPTDLVKMMHGYTNGFIDTATTKEMFTSHRLKDGKQTQVGIAWRNSIDAFGNPLIEHAGSWLGTRTVIVHYPKENLNISIMINADCHVFIEETAHIIAQLVRDKPQINLDSEMIKDPIEGSYNNRDTLQSITGNFYLENGKGLLHVNDLKLFEDAPIYALHNPNEYAVITHQGIFFMRMNLSTNSIAKIFVYGKQLDTPPQEGKPLISFKVNAD